MGTTDTNQTTQPATKARKRKTMRHTILGARSMVRSVTKRIANHDQETDWDMPELDELIALVADAEAALGAAIAARKAIGMSWADIGAELGVTRQAAQQRFGKYTRT